LDIVPNQKWALTSAVTLDFRLSANNRYESAPGFSLALDLQLSGITDVKLSKLLGNFEAV